MGIYGCFVEGWMGGSAASSCYECYVYGLVPLHPGFRLWAASLSAARFGPSVGPSVWPLGGGPCPLGGIWNQIALGLIFDACVVFC